MYHDAFVSMIVLTRKYFEYICLIWNTRCESLIDNSRRMVKEIIVMTNCSQTKQQFKLLGIVALLVPYMHITKDT